MLVNMSKLLADAQKGNYAVGSFSVANMEMVLGVLKASEELNAPVILQIAEVRLKQSPLELIGPLMVASAKYAKTPVAVHFDHGKTIEKISQALELGFTSVMFDGSHLELDENIKVTKEVIKLAKKYGADVEAEIGCVGGSEDGSEDIAINCTKPEDAVKFEKETGVDALAIAIGTAHGAYKAKPCLDIERLREIRKKVATPLVLHGGSGLSDDDFRNTVKEGIAKVNIFTDLCVAGENAMQYSVKNNLSYLETRNKRVEYIKAAIKEKIVLFGSKNKA